MIFRKIRGEKRQFSFLLFYPWLLLARKVWSLPGYLARFQPIQESCKYDDSKDVFPSSRKHPLLEIASQRTLTNRSPSMAALSSLKSRKEEKYRYIYIYICTDRSIDRMGKFVSENPWKKKSRYRAAVTVMRLSTDSLLRHHINIRSNLFERIFPRAARPGRNLITIYGHVLYPVTDSGSSLRRYPPPPIRDSQSFKLDTFLSTNLPLIPIQSKFL